MAPHPLPLGLDAAAHWPSFESHSALNSASSSGRLIARDRVVVRNAVMSHRDQGFAVFIETSSDHIPDACLPWLTVDDVFPQVSLLLAIFGLFHSCPTLVDPIIAGCLFLCHPRTAKRMRLVIPLGLVALVPSILLPTMRHVWLQAGTGNANFYYFQTVALNVLLSVFVLQFVAALVKRRKALAVALRKRRGASLLAREARGGKGTRGCGDR